jgi:hypothetical protein
LKRTGTRANAVSRSGIWIVVAFGLSPLACGTSGPEMARVAGKVTYQGKPVTQGTVTFQATSPGGRNATGLIDSSGNYTLQTENPGDGALLGDYLVTIYAHDEPILDYIPKTPVKPKLLVPAKYEKPGTSGLKATVHSGSNPINFELTD